MGPAVHESEGVVVKRMESAFVMVGEEFSLPCGHVDVDGALDLAGFAGEAQVQRLFHFGAVPAVLDDVALHHLPKKMSAAAGRVLLFASRHETWTHGVIVLLAACANTDAARRGVAKGAVIAGILEPCRLPGGCISCPDPEIFCGVINGNRINQLARIHAIQRVPQCFECGKRLHEFRAKHLG